MTENEHREEATTTDVKKMSLDELRKEVYRLRHKVTNLGERIKAKDAVIDHLKSSDVKKIVEAIEKVIPFGSLRRLG